MKKIRGIVDDIWADDYTYEDEKIEYVSEREKEGFNEMKVPVYDVNGKRVIEILKIPRDGTSVTTKGYFWFPNERKFEMLEEIKKAREYLDYIEEHYNNVQKAWKTIQEKCDGKSFADFLYDDHKFFVLDAIIKDHDLSKLSQEEFVVYRKKFFPTKLEKELQEQDQHKRLEVKREFDKAWEYHKANNAHHWENWTNDGIQRQDFHLVHNICDWMAMGMKFNDTAKEYYEKNKEKIKLSEWAIKLMYEIFDCIY